MAARGQDRLGGGAPVGERGPADAHRRRDADRRGLDQRAVGDLRRDGGARVDLDPVRAQVLPPIGLVRDAHRQIHRGEEGEARGRGAELDSERGLIQIKLRAVRAPGVRLVDRPIPRGLVQIAVERDHRPGDRHRGLRVRD
ncbi:MAG: hypothetical protein ACK559_25955, partial [bacterium]